MITFENSPEDFATLPVGTEISEEVYFHFFDLLPPLRLRDSLFVGFQSSEPYSYEKKKDGSFAPTYMTFAKKAGKYFYAGTNFYSVCSWNGKEA